jgi:hypothetical protein
MSIDKIILQDSTRGMDILYNEYPKEYCKEAVEYFLTLAKGNIFLYTGFYINGFAETDGPLGTYFLAKALNTLGYKAIIICDKYCEDYFFEIDTIYVSLEGYSSNKYNEILSDYNPICHIAIERCGKNTNNKYENARGLDISKYTAPIDDLYILGSKTKPSFAIGDGGNEIGMGYFQDVIQQYLEVIPCRVSCDYPIIASVSNWGAYGFIAYLQKFTNTNLLPSFEELDTYLGFIVSKGCVDGIKQEQVKSVDGKNWSMEQNIISALQFQSSIK